MKKKIFGILTGAWAVTSLITAHIFNNNAKHITYIADDIDPIEQIDCGIYEEYVKRVLDIFCASAAIVVFCPIYAGTALLVRIKLGSPVLFVQERPGRIGPDGKETIFKLYKFRSMTDARDEDGNLLPDDARLTPFGKKLRATSLDELPEAFNILNGTMSVIGPRPQLVRDMVFMTREQRKRHIARPGLSGLAQIKGRNAITWEDKLAWDIEYINNINILNDIKIVWATFKQVFIRNQVLNDNADTELTLDFGDALLEQGKISKKQYNKMQDIAKKITKRT